MGEFNPFKLFEIAHIDGTHSWCCVETNVDLWNYSDHFLSRGAEICHWIGDREIFYERIAVGAPPQGGYQRQKYKHRFYFKNAAWTPEFKAKLLEVEAMEESCDVLESLSNYVAIMGNDRDIPAEACLRFRAKDAFDSVTYELWTWIKDNLKGRVLNGGYFLAFEYKEDATLFKVKYFSDK